MRLLLRTTTSLLAAPVTGSPGGAQLHRGRSTRAAHRLSREHVDSILRASEYSYTVPEFDGKNVSVVMGFESNQLPSNSPIEDRRAAATCLQSGGMLLGVFDGHAGPACAQALSERLFYYVAMALLPTATLRHIEDAVEARRSVPPVLLWHKHPYDYVNRESAALYFQSLRTYWQELIDLDDGTQPDVADALAGAFARLDSDLSLEAQAGTPSRCLTALALRSAFSGATACVALVCDGELHVANVGDSRAVLGRRAGAGWEAVPLSRDHCAENPAEVARLHAEHPESERRTVLRHGRLLGALAPLRAFGDVKFKWSQELQRRVLESGADLVEGIGHRDFFPQDYHSPPYLNARPEVSRHRLGPGDRFLVLATDGLWEMLDMDDVVRTVGDYLEATEGGAVAQRHQQERREGGSVVRLGEMHGRLLLQQRQRQRATPGGGTTTTTSPDTSPSADRNAATALVRRAVGRDESGRVCEERVAEMLGLPEELARMYRDDITVTVVVFNPSVLDGEHR
ncbi:pyruvate dehyrogenase phosphatase catalytic subunit 1 [Petromyzon marinus]|uniref:pyruvate dehyrogenase phosphatase catalytic subunit 1 n=1 Tax=Petromyzon marinus TaxID=7757 RepID=UPI003F7112B3